MPVSAFAHRQVTGLFTGTIIAIIRKKIQILNFLNLCTGVAFVSRGGDTLHRYYIVMHMNCTLPHLETVNFRTSSRCVSRSGNFGLPTAVTLIFIVMFLMTCGDVEANPGPWDITRRNNKAQSEDTAQSHRPPQVLPENTQPQTTPQNQQSEATTELLAKKTGFSFVYKTRISESNWEMTRPSGSHACAVKDLNCSLKLLSRSRRNLARYASHIHFLTSCKVNNVHPKGMTLRFPEHALPKSDSLKQMVKSSLRKAEQDIMDACISCYDKCVDNEKDNISQTLYHLHQTINDYDYFDSLVFSHRRELNALKVKHNREKRKKLHKLLQQADVQPHPNPPQPNHSLRPKTKRNRRFKRRSDNKVIFSNPKLVVNLSKFPLSDSQRDLLALGPKFCPTPQALNSNQLYRDVEEGCRRVRLKEYHYDPDDDSDPSPPPKFYSPTYWAPPSGRDLAIDAFCATLQSKTRNFKNNRSLPDNLVPEQRQALTELSSEIQNRNIRITQADKGGAVVILDTKDYIQEAHRQLEDPTYYIKLQKDTTLSIAKTSNQLMDSLYANEHIDKDTHRWAVVQPNQVRTHQFYILPKIHKTLVNPPGRPIVSGTNGPTEKPSKLCDFWLHDYVTRLPSYIKDTTDMLQTINRWNRDHGPFPPQTQLVTMDVTSLYSNIPHDELLTALKHFLDTPLPQSTTPRPPTQDILGIVKHILTNNVFSFEDQIYCQIRGTAMGTPMAPSAANLFMGWLEKNLQSASPIAFPTQYWKRYIDDIFFLWTDSEANLNSFFSFLNNSHPSIKFTMDHSLTNLPFLDISISLKDGFLHTDLYTKPTDSHAYLPATSCHPSHVIRNIPYSQFLRLLRLCSDRTVFNSRCKTLETWLLERGYKSHAIKKARSKASLIPRTTALEYKHKQTTDRPPLVVTHNPHNPPLHHWLAQLHKSIIQTSSRAKKAVPEPPILGQRNPPTLRSLLMPSVLPPAVPHISGCYKCNNKRCVMCAEHLVSSMTVKSDQTDKTYQLQDRLSCDSTNVVYLLYCDTCKNAQYIGETKNSLKTRFYLHRSHIKKNTGTLVTQHFNQPNHSMQNMKCIAVERVYGKGVAARLHRERVWMNRLKTLHPLGLNSNE